MIFSHIHFIYLCRDQYVPQFIHYSVCPLSQTSQFQPINSFLIARPQKFTFYFISYSFKPFFLSAPPHRPFAFAFPATIPWMGWAIISRGCECFVVPKPQLTTIIWPVK
jgi:hypothetical protein